MTTFKAIEIRCDRDGCTTPGVLGDTAAEAREAAHNRGWITVIRNSRNQDFCSSHVGRVHPPTARADCGLCGRTGLRLRADGTVRNHKPPKPEGQRFNPHRSCKGSYQPPARIVNTAAPARDADQVGRQMAAVDTVRLSAQ